MITSEEGVYMKTTMLVISVVVGLMASQGFAQGNRPPGAGNGGGMPSSASPGSEMSTMGEMHSSQMSSGPMAEQGRAMSDQMRDATPEQRAEMGRAMEESSDAMQERREAAMEDREELMNMDRDRDDMPESAIGRPEALPEQANDRAVEMQERSEERQEIMEQAREEGTEPGKKPWWKFWGD